MPTKSTYYINGSTFANATAVFMDANLTTCAPDGFYSFGGIVRELNNCVLLPPTNCPSCEFICEWDTSNISTGSSTAFQVQLPVVPSGTYDYTIDWGDGVVERKTSYAQAVLPHTYPSSGVYTTRITGVIKGWSFGNATVRDRNKILQVKQWGCFNTGNQINCFNNCNNLTMLNVTDTIDLTGVTTLRGFFTECTSLTLVNKINEWDVSGITNFFAMFFGCVLFNDNVNDWDVSNATTYTGLNQPEGLHGVFKNCSVFNQPLNNWDVSQVRTINAIFEGCNAFVQDITMWDVGEVRDFQAVFKSNTIFNQAIGSWDTSSALTFKEMFSGATLFNQAIGLWNTSGATGFDNMFFNATAFNQPIGTWDVSSAFDMSGMFQNALAFNQDIGAWNVSGVADFTLFMAGKTNLNYSSVNMDSLLNGWIVNELSPFRIISFGTIVRTAAGTEARELLVRSKGTFPDRAVVNVTNSAGLILVEATAHGMSTGNKVFIADVVGTVEANGLATITVINPNEFTIDGSTFVNAYISGGTVICAYGWTMIGATL